MADRLPVGHRGVVERVVTEDLTAAALGNPGVDLMGTPFLTWLVELASTELVLPYLDEGEATVGIQMVFNHLAPTPVGMKVMVNSDLVSVEGKKLTFKFEAFDEVEKIGEGTHTRAIVNLQKILDRARAKKRL